MTKERVSNRLILDKILEAQNQMALDEKKREPHVFDMKLGVQVAVYILGLAVAFTSLQSDVKNATKSIEELKSSLMSKAGTSELAKVEQAVAGLAATKERVGVLDTRLETLDGRLQRIEEALARVLMPYNQPYVPPPVYQPPSRRSKQ